MNVLEAIKARRSVRKFEHLPVTSADIRVLLQAAVQAPNALNEPSGTLGARLEATRAAGVVLVA